MAVPEPPAIPSRLAHGWVCAQVCWGLTKPTEDPGSGAARCPEKRPCPAAWHQQRCCPPATAGGGDHRPRTSGSHPGRDIAACE